MEQVDEGLDRVGQFVGPEAEHFLEGRGIIRRAGHEVGVEKPERGAGRQVGETLFALGEFLLRLGETLLGLRETAFGLRETAFEFVTRGAAVPVG